MKRKFILLITLFLITKQLHAQTYTFYWDRTYGGDKYDAPCTITKAGNKKYLLQGSSITNVNGDKTDPLCGIFQLDDEWLVMLDSNFNIIWNRGYGGSGSEFALGSLVANQNGGFVFSSVSVSNTSCEKTQNYKDTVTGYGDFWLCAIDANNTKLWDKTIGTYQVEDESRLVQLSSGDYILAGYTADTLTSGDKTVPNHSGTDIWVIKLDSMGNKLWDKVYGGYGDEGIGSGYYGFGTNSTLLADGTDFIIGIVNYGPTGFDVTDSSKGGNDVWLIKIDSAGNKIWDKRYGGTNDELCAHITRTLDGGYIFCGSTRSPQGFDVSDTSRGQIDYWVVKLDNMGNKQWDHRYGGNYADFSTWIEEAPGGGYWVCGISNSDATGEVSEPSLNFCFGSGSNIICNYDYWIVKIDSVGNKLWDKRFGGELNEFATNFLILDDTSIVICGYADSCYFSLNPSRTDPGKGKLDYWLVHFKYDDYSVGIHENNDVSNNVKVSPNPFKESITVTPNTTGSVEFTLHDVTARKMLTKTFSHSAVINTAQLSSGIYFYSVKNKTGVVGVGKVIKN